MSRSYLVESYCPDPGGAVPGDAVDRVLAAVRALRREGREVSFRDGMVLPSDQVIFYRFAGWAGDDVAAVCAAAGIPVTRITEYLGIGDRPGTTSVATGPAGFGPSALRPGEVQR